MSVSVSMLSACNSPAPAPVATNPAAAPTRVPDRLHDPLTQLLARDDGEAIIYRFNATADTWLRQHPDQSRWIGVEHAPPGTMTDRPNPGLPHVRVPNRLLRPLAALCDDRLRPVHTDFGQHEFLIEFLDAADHPIARFDFHTAGGPQTLFAMVPGALTDGAQQFAFDRDWHEWKQTLDAIWRDAADE